MLIYEANYANATMTVTTSMEEIILFVKDTKVSANVRVWQSGNCIMAFQIKFSN